MAIQFYQRGIIDDMPSKLVVDEGEIPFAGLVDTLCGEYGTHVKKSIITEDGELKDGLMLIVNGRIFKRKDVLSLVISDGSVVMVSIILAGR